MKPNQQDPRENDIAVYRNLEYRYEFSKQERTFPIKGKKVLLFLLDGLGDTVLLVPVINQLKKEHCDIYLVCDGRLEDFFIPFKINVLGYSSKSGSLRAVLHQIAIKLKGKHFDVVFDFDFPRTYIAEFIRSLDCSLSVGFFQKRGSTYGFDSSPTRHSLTLEYDSKVLRAYNNFNLLSFFDISSPSIENDYPVSKSEGRNKNYTVTVSVSTNNAAREWPLEYFKQLIEGMCERFKGVKINIIGLDRKLPVEHESVQNFISRLSIPQEADLIRSSDLFIGNNSLHMHLAALFGIESIIIFNDNLDFYTPLNTKNTIIRADFKVTSPQRCRKEHLEMIKPLLVLQVAEKVIAQNA